MIVVEAGHAIVMKFLPLLLNCQFFFAVIVIFYVKSAVMGVLFNFFKLMIESKNIELFYATNSTNIELFCTYFFYMQGQA
jgi:hypothetical protein